MDRKQFLQQFEIKEVIEYPNEVSKSPTVSVLIQTFNHKTFINDCLDSIINQEADFPFEIILGDDGSTDGTREICISYAKKYPKLIKLFLHNDSNKIQVEGLKTGNFNAFYNFFHSKGKYIAFCEGDDYWLDNLKLQKQIDFLIKKKQFAFSYHRYIEKLSLDEKHHTLLDQPDFDLSMEDLIQLRYHPHLSTVCFKNIFSQLPKEMLQVINVDSFILSLLGNYGPGKYLENISPNIYRRHSQGIWTKNKNIQKLKLKSNTVQKLIDYYQSKENIEVVKYYKRYLRNINRSLFISFLFQKKFFPALKLIPKIF